MVINLLNGIKYESNYFLKFLKCTSKNKSYFQYVTNPNIINIQAMIMLGTQNPSYDIVGSQRKIYIRPIETFAQPSRKWPRQPCREKKGKRGICETMLALPGTRWANLNWALYKYINVRNSRGKAAVKGVHSSCDSFDCEVRKGNRKARVTIPTSAVIFSNKFISNWIYYHLVHC